MRAGRPWAYFIFGILTTGCVHRPGPPSSPCIDDPKPVDFRSVLTIVPGGTSGAVGGLVLVREDNTPLPDAGVWIDPPNGPTVRTAADGRFTFGDVAPGRHAVVMRRIGFESLRDSITVPVTGELRIEAQQSMLDGGCEGLGAVRTAIP
jgi:hypothetical protein